MYFDLDISSNAEALVAPAGLAIVASPSCNGRIAGL